MPGKDVNPAVLFNEHIMDTGNLFNDTGSLTVNVDQNLLMQHRYVYLCTFNMGDWRPVFGVQVNDGICNFTGITRELLYVLGIYEGNRIIPIFCRMK